MESNLDGDVRLNSAAGEPLGTSTSMDSGDGSDAARSGDPDSSFRQAMSLMSQDGECRTRDVPCHLCGGCCFTAHGSLDAAERLDIEHEAKKIGTNVRAWLLQKNYRNVRQSMVRFQARAFPTAAAAAAV